MFLAGRALLVVALLTLGCGGSADEDESGGPPAQPKSDVPLLGADCDPMVPQFCGLPFPSDVYLADDPSGLNPSGKSVRFGPTTLPTRTIDGAHFPPDLLYDFDGFSPSQAPMTFLPLAACDECATPLTIEKSTQPGHPTVLLEVPTGRLVPHWVDFDSTTPNNGLEDYPDERLTLIRPAERLKAGTRYIAAIRDVHDVNGKLIPASAVFRALRDKQSLASGSAAAKWSVYARKALYEDIFETLVSAGVERSSLQIAWDYTTATTENITGHMLSLRDKALAVVGDDGPTFSVKQVEELPGHSELLRRIHLVMTVPLYLTSVHVDHSKTEPLDRLNLDENGELVQNGTMDWDVLILVPKSVESGEKHGLLQNGHGLFGSRTEGQDGYLARAANRNKWIAFSINLFGFDGDSDPLAFDGLLGRFEALKSFSERQIQGMVNQLLAMRMMLGRVAKDGIQDDNGTLVLDPAWIDPSVRGYRGDSQGGIMGGTYMSISTDVTRGLLGETGMPYNLLLNRSVDFAGFAIILEGGFGSNGVAAQLLLALIQMPWDRSEPSGFAPHLESDPLPNTPAHQVLIHSARGDHQVTTFGAQVMCRSIGCVQLASNDPATPVWEEMYGIETTQAPVQNRSALVEYEFGLAPNPLTNLPNQDGCDPHDRVRDLIPSFDQQDVFFRTGTIEWTCTGACNCNDAMASDPAEEERCDQTECN